MQRIYPIQVFWDNDAYVAVATDLGCSAIGDTVIQAIDELDIVIENWLEIAKDIGKPIPQPTKVNFTQPFKLKELTV